MNTDHAMSELLPWYAAGSLGEDEHARVEAHLATCAICRDELAQWQAVGATLRHAEARIPADEHAEAGWAMLAGWLSTPPYGDLVVRESLGSRAAIRASAARKGLLAVHSDRITPQSRKPTAAITIAASLVLVVAIVGSFTVLHLGQCSVGGASHHPPTFPPEQRILTEAPPANIGLPDGTTLNDLTMISPDEGWAVGGVNTFDRSKLGQSTNVQYEGSLLLHFQAGYWSVSYRGPADIWLDTITMLSASEGWAVGYLRATPGGAVYLHYARGQWINSDPPEPLPTSGKGTYQISQLWAPAANDVWFAGAFPTTPGRPPLPGSLWHYDGHTLHEVMESQGTRPRALVPIPGAGPGSAYMMTIVGELPDSTLHSVISKYEAGVLTSQIITESNVVLDRFIVISPSDIWASGETWATVGVSASSLPKPPVLYHFDGTQWTRENLSMPHGITDMVMTGHDEGLAFASADVADASGWFTDHRVTAAYHYKDGVWTTMKLPDTLHSISNFAVSSSDDVWAIGQYDISWVIQHKNTTLDGFNYQGSVLLHYINGKWVQYKGAS